MKRIISKLKSIHLPALADVLEIVVFLAWAIYMTSSYLNFDKQVWFAGSDFPRNIQIFSTWQNLPVCGDCIMWNGTINGGAPAFAENFAMIN